VSLVDEYPKKQRNLTPQLRKVLGQVPGLGPRDSEDLAMAINNMADKAHDLNDIVERLVRGQDGLAEVGELLIAFELTTEQLRGDSDLINGKLYDCGDRLKKVARNGRD
jgi:hypothetical protein